MEDEDPLVTALRALCSANGGHAAVGREIGANGQTIYQIVNGVRLPSGMPRGVGRSLRERLDARFPGWRGASAAASGDFVEVRRADVKASNGAGRLVFSEDDLPPLSFRAEFLRTMGIAAHNAVVVTATGNSNEPKIPNGSVVLIDRGDRDHLAGAFFAFRVDGELLIKRLMQVEGVGILAIAENPNFTPKTRVYAAGTDLEVIGRAVWIGAVL